MPDLNHAGTIWNICSVGDKSGDAVEGVSPILQAGRQRAACTAGVSRFATAAMDLLASGGSFGMLLGQDGKRPGMGLPVVLGQDLAEAAGAIGDRAVADLAASHGKADNGDGEAAGL
jgi:hypothetical protein